MVTKAVAVDPAPAPDPTPVVIPPLPTWTDAASVSSYITTVLAGVFAVVIYVTGHGEPTIVQALVPSVSVIVAGVAQLVNIVTHRSAQKAAYEASRW